MPRFSIISRTGFKFSPLIYSDDRKALSRKYSLVSAFFMVNGLKEGAFFLAEELDEILGCLAELGLGLVDQISLR